MKKIIKNLRNIFIKTITYLKNFLINKKDKILTILLLSIPLILMDLITRLFGLNIGFFKLNKLVPNLFNLSWILLFIGITLSFKKKIGKKIYLIINIIFLFVFLTNNVYYSLTKTFFDFSLVESTSEGAPYIVDTIKSTNPLVYLSLVIIIITIAYSYKKIPYKTKNNYKLLVIIIITFTLLHSITPLLLGKANQELTWSSWRNPRNIYKSFNDNNKSFQITGLYEYTFRNFYITFLKTDKQESEEDIEFLNAAFSETKKDKNEYTGKFKNKNLIIVQLEGTDNWLITKKDTPTLYKMMNNSINFTNHFSYYNGGGSTFNSEFAVNTGFITPLSYTQNAYTFSKNDFPYSLANIFKEKKYTVNAFHMNYGEYYSRKVNYLNWGYDNYYGLLDYENFSDKTYRLDRNLILNETFNKLLFNTNENDEHFLNYIITYSGHLPFSNSNNESVCKLLYDIDNEGKENIEFKEMTEEECIRRQAKETDYMMELMLKELKTRNILNDTIIAVFTDHYLYTVSDKTILEKYKETKNNLINKTPFFIYDGGKTNKKINKVTSQLNILPTILNLYGIDYNPNNYIEKDALSKNYSQIVFFSDYSWYNGTVYVEDGIVTNKKKISKSKLEESNYYINYITKKNDLALKYNYFKRKR